MRPSPPASGASSSSECSASGNLVTCGLPDLAVNAAASVTIAYRRSRDEMPARAEEVDHAEAEGVSGFARNLPDGRVEFLLQGETDAVRRVLEKVRTGPTHSRVRELQVEEARDTPALRGFVTR